jgi:hypothetical protein
MPLKPNLTYLYYWCSPNILKTMMYCQLPSKPTFTIPEIAPSRPNTTKDSLDNPQHHKPNWTTPDTQFMHSKQSFINLLKFLQEFALQIRMTQQRPPTQSKHCNAPSSTVHPCAEDAHSGTLSTHSCRRPEIGSHEFSSHKQPHSLIPHIKHPLTESTTFWMIKPLWTSQMIPGTPPHVSTYLQIA